MILGERVEKLRRERRLSQEDLARHAHISQGLLSCIERGQTKNPGAETLKGLARALGCSIDYLVGLYDENPSRAAAPAGALR